MGNASGALDCDFALGTRPDSPSPGRSAHLRLAPAFSRVFILATIILIVAPPVRGDTLAKVRESGRLSYGSDKEGGGPYAYPDPNEPRAVTGFEVELMDALAHG